MTEIGTRCVAVLAAVLLAVGCDRSRGRVEDTSRAAPSASVLTIVAGIGYCEDLRSCENECEAGSSDRCRRLGVNYEFGHDVAVSGVRATELYEKSCAMMNTDACVAAGRMYEFHHGVAKDDVKAVSLYSRACELGDATGCANFAIMLENGRGTSKDLPRAREYFGRACTRGSSLACARARSIAGIIDAGRADGG